jgi:hypothetical protein
MNTQAKPYRWHPTMDTGFILLCCLLAACAGLFTLPPQSGQAASATTIIHATRVHRSLPPQAKRVRCPAVNGNPWCYNFLHGTLIYQAPRTFCHYFKCVSDFWQADRGYVVECQNGRYSHFGGIPGACRDDGGVRRALHQRVLLHTL